MSDSIEPIGTIRPGIGRAWLASFLDPSGDDEAVEAFGSLERARRWLAGAVETSIDQVPEFRWEYVNGQLGGTPVRTLVAYVKEIVE